MSQIQITGEAKIRDLQGPVVANSGVITALDGAANQYVRGDGTLASFPTSTGGGSSVSFYLNGSVNQGTFGGSAYKQLGQNAITGVGTNFSASANGLIAQFITDANVPDQTEIPSGNWNIEFYMGVSASSGALASFYVEIYKYDGSTFTLIGSNAATPEYLTNTTTIDAYFTSVAMPLTALAQTDRIAVRVFVNVAGKTVTLYTEDNRLCQVVTTFSRGILSLNNLTDQQQYLTVGTAGTDFNIVSALDTHTFNIPSASATNRGLITTGTQTIAGAKTFSSTATFNTGGVFNNWGISLYDGAGSTALSSSTLTGIYASKSGSITDIVISHNAPYDSILRFSNDVANFTYTFPDLSGTIALLEGTQTFTGIKTFNLSPINETGIQLKNDIGIVPVVSGYTNLNGLTNGLAITNSSGVSNNLLVPATTGYSYTFPASSGTLALTSDLSSYVPYSGATGPVDLGSYDLLVNGVRAGKGGGTGSNNTRFGALAFMANTTGSYNAALGTLTLNANTTGANNTAVGNAALQLNTTGGSNTSVGAFTLTNNTTGVGNVALGTGSLAGITTGSYNIAIGINTANLITTGDFNTIIGNYSGSTNLTSNIILADGAGNVRYQWNGTNNVFGNAVQASAYRLTGMTAGSGALYWTSDRVTLANYNASGVVHIEANGGTGVATFGGATYNNDFVGTGRFSGGNLRFDNLSNSIFRGIVFGATPADATEYAYIKYQPSAGHFRIFGSPAGFGGLTTFENNGIQWLQVNTNNTLNFTGATTFNSSVTATGFFESSDKRIKKEITDNPTIKGIESIKPKLYVKAEKEELGYYAQDLQEVLPSAVTEGSDGFLSLSYAQVHTAKIAQLETEVAELKELIKKLL